jgi:hypothetical protein
MDFSKVLPIIEAFLPTIAQVVENHISNPVAKAAVLALAEGTKAVIDAHKAQQAQTSP